MTGPGDLQRLDTGCARSRRRRSATGCMCSAPRPKGHWRAILRLRWRGAARGWAGGKCVSDKALADDLGLGFDPLSAELGAQWTGPRPAILTGDDPWRTAGDTVEAVGGVGPAAGGWRGSAGARVGCSDGSGAGPALAPAIAPAARRGRGLADRAGWRAVAPGPSGAPTRGRPDVLPTGRNFYSVDTRAVPTQTAWRLGQASANLLVERHLRTTATGRARAAADRLGHGQHADRGG